MAARASGISRFWTRARHATRANDRRGARRNVMAHYDLGNDFYAAWLDPTMSYSSGIFAEPIDGTEPLEQAQRRKLAEVERRIESASPGKVLEIGCGWGSLSGLLSQSGHDVKAISLSPSQLAYARRASAEDRQPPCFELCDYRDVTGTYDAVVSIEMVEAVGQRYWPDFLDTLARALKPGGRAVVQYITIADDIFERYAGSADFIQTYIFPGGMLLSQSRFRALAEARGLCWVDQHDFGWHYAETLRLWRVRFDAAVEDGRLPGGFDARFVALWRYYLMYCEGGFRGGGIDVSLVTFIRE
jgi:cyclopropane-fatty-acyl-phospholipid synthase